MVSRLKHDNVVELIGYCIQGNLRVLAYEFATMGSLHDILHGDDRFHTHEILQSHVTIMNDNHC